MVAKQVWLYRSLWENDYSSLDLLTLVIFQQICVSISSFKSSSKQHDVDLLNCSPFRFKQTIKQGMFLERTYCDWQVAAVSGVITSLPRIPNMVTSVHRLQISNMAMAAFQHGGGHTPRCLWSLTLMSLSLSLSLVNQRWICYFRMSVYL